MTTEHEKNESVENDVKCKDDLKKGTETNQIVAKETMVVIDSDDQSSDINNSHVDGGKLTGGGSSSSCLVSCTVYRPIPPFLLKIYDMLENDETKSVITWGSNGTSFVVTNPHLFSDNVLPLYFRHNNFQSFISQLNSYGFKKISWEQWEYGNEYFRKGERHLLKNITRRTQIHHRIHPTSNPSDAHLSVTDNELESMIKEHHQLKSEITKLKAKQDALQQKLAALENQAIASIEEDTKGIMEMSEEALLRKRKLETRTKSDDQDDDDKAINVITVCSQFDDDNNNDNALADVVELMAEHINQHGDKMVVDEEEIGKNEENVFISVEDMINGESSDWAEYFKGLIEKASSFKS